MLILCLRTDKPEAELTLFNNEQQLDHITWLAHRELAETLHKKINSLLNAHGKRLRDLKGIVAYKGPGSFTGLRIGITVANTLADGLGIKIVGTTSREWQLQGIRSLLKGQNDVLVMPDYGSDPHTTTPRK